MEPRPPSRRAGDLKHSTDAKRDDHLFVDEHADDG